MNKYRFVIPAILFLTILLVGCGNPINRPPAPTSIPLPTLGPDQVSIDHSATPSAHRLQLGLPGYLPFGN